MCVGKINFCMILKIANLRKPLCVPVVEPNTEELVVYIYLIEKKDIICMKKFPPFATTDSYKIFFFNFHLK